MCPAILYSFLRGIITFRLLFRSSVNCVRFRGRKLSSISEQVVFNDSNEEIVTPDRRSAFYGLSRILIAFTNRVAEVDGSESKSNLAYRGIKQPLLSFDL